MCDVCRGWGDCPVCGPEIEDLEQELDDMLNAADNANQREKEEQI